MSPALVENGGDGQEERRDWKEVEESEWNNIIDSAKVADAASDKG